MDLRARPVFLLAAPALALSRVRSSVRGRRSIEITAGVLAVAAMLAATTTLVLPIVQLEGARDWPVYAEAGRALQSGSPLYAGSGRDGLFLYPPAMALLWTTGIGDGAWVIAKLGALALMAAGGVPGALAAGLGLATTPVQHDFVLGNVMVFYLVAVALVAFRGGLPGSIALGAVMAFALKPTLIPILAWMLLLRPRDLARTIGVAVVISLVSAVLVGPERYVEYLQALPTFGVLATSWPGNLGVSAAVGAQAALVVSIGSLAATLAAALRWGERALPITIALSLLFQPSLGVIYAVLLIPAIVLVWDVDRRATLALGLAVPVIVLVSPVIAATLVAATAAWVLMAAERRRAPGLDEGQTRLVTQ